MSPRTVPHRTISKTFRQEFGGFCGWPEIIRVINSVVSSQIVDIFVGLFVTGGRRGELSRLTRRQVDLDYSDDIIMVRGMYVEKQRERIPMIDEYGDLILDERGKRRYILESVPGYRTFPISKDEPSSEVFIDYVENFAGIGGDLLYPYSGTQIYYRIAQIDARMPRGANMMDWNKYKGPWWPHRIRAERACQLARDYRFDILRLKTFFGWKVSSMAELYSSLEAMDLIETVRRERSKLV